MQINTEKNQREIKEHGNFQFPVNVSMESIQSFEQGMFLWHWHPEIELTWVMSGEMEYRVNDTTYHLKAGEGLFGNSNTLHAGNQINSKNCSYLSITFHPRFLYGYEGSILQSGYVDKITENESWDALLLNPEVGWQMEILGRMRRIWQLSLQAGQCRMEHADLKEWFSDVDGGVGIGDAYSVEVVTPEVQSFACKGKSKADPSSKSGLPEMESSTATENVEEEAPAEPLSDLPAGDDAAKAGTESARSARKVVRVMGDITEESGGQLTFLNQKPQDYELSVLIELLEIWRALYRYFISQPEQTGAHARNLDRLRDMIGFLQENAAGELHLEDVASRVGLCKSECCRYFKKYMNMTIFEYLLFLRVQNSLPYLRQGESVTRTAGLVGFGSASYFTQIFRRYMKCSPREYKNR